MSAADSEERAAERLALLQRGRKGRAVRNAGAHHEQAALEMPSGPERIDPATFTGSDAERLAALENALDQADDRARAGIDMMKAWLDEQRGVVLREIRDSELYKVRADTFEQYVSDRWQMSRPRAYALMEAAPVLRVMSSIEDTRPAVSQALALAPVYERDGEKGVRTALREAEAAARVEGKRVTAATLKRTVRALGYSSPGGSVPEQRDQDDDGQEEVTRGSHAVAVLGEAVERQRRLYDSLPDLLPLALAHDPGRAEHLVRELRQYANRTAYRLRGRDGEPDA
ncbi:hypothetical protein [Streptomyces sp. TR06-5]|uniref:hypothetical protein n=1 Tax=Streptomyces sp. TR06-5 TaxID=3385976 RepID=UPI0039A36AC9